MESTTGAGGFTHLFTQPWQAALEGHSPHTGNGTRTLVSHTYFPQFCTQPRQGTHVRTYSTHTHTTTRHGPPPPRWPTQLHTRPRPGTPGAHTCREYTLPCSPAHSPRLSHPRVSRPRLFFWKLCSPSPPPRPEVLAVFLAALVSAPFLPVLPAQ